MKNKDTTMFITTFKKSCFDGSTIKDTNGKKAGWLVFCLPFGWPIVADQVVFCENRPKSMKRKDDDVRLILNL
jgi:hypothetical protein